MFKPKELMKLKYEKNKVEQNISDILDFLNRHKKCIRVFKKESGTAEKDEKQYTFITWKFYIKM